MNVLITGASQGLGYAMAHYFAQQNWNVAICARNNQKIMELKNELETKYKINVFAKSVDLTNTNETQHFAVELLAQFNNIDVLINNAGSFVQGNITQNNLGELTHMIEANLYSAFNMTTALIPQFINQKKGHIFMLGSVAGLQAYHNGGSYSIAKHALHGYAANLRIELMQHQIKVTNIVPGATYTPSWDGSGVEKNRIMESNDIAKIIYAATQLSPQACPEQIVLRPQLGDL
jgi:short-subunit dehydrogenase